VTYRAVHSFPAGSGGGGSSPAPTNSSYVQTFTVPDTTWTVTHPLATDTPDVTCYAADGTWLGDAGVYVPNNYTVVITWALPVAGRAKIGI
jgi:hypothetical protein